MSLRRQRRRQPVVQDTTEDEDSEDEDHVQLQVLPPHASEPVVVIAHNNEVVVGTSDHGTSDTEYLASDNTEPLLSSGTEYVSDTDETDIIMDSDASVYEGELEIESDHSNVAHLQDFNGDRNVQAEIIIESNGVGRVTPRRVLSDDDETEDESVLPELRPHNPAPPSSQMNVDYDAETEDELATPPRPSTPRPQTPRPSTSIINPVVLVSSSDEDNNQNVVQFWGVVADTEVVIEHQGQPSPLTTLQGAINSLVDSSIRESAEAAASPARTHTAAASSSTFLTPARSALAPVAAARLNSSAGEFRSPAKRKRIATPSPEKASPGAASEVDEEAECCSICFEQWTTSGKHRISALKCGHLFGQNCIERWLKGQGGKCPQCNAKATKKDVRVIYARALRVLDTTERDRAIQDLEAERAKRQAAELDAAQARLRCQITVDECERLKKQLARQSEMMSHIRTNGGPMPHSQSTGFTSSQAAAHTGVGSYVYDRLVKVCESGNCRVMSYCAQLATLAISHPTTNPLFPGFGVKKLSALDFKTSQFIHLHSKMIRDLCFNNAGLLLSCSVDKTIKMTSLTANTTVHTNQCGLPVWSCAWNEDDQNYFYAGLQNGSVLVFDIRNTAESVRTLSQDAARSPVVSVQYISADPHASFRSGGVLVGQLDRATFYESKIGGILTPHALPLDGATMYMSFEESSRHILTSYRPSARHNTVRHQVTSLSKHEPDVCMMQQVQCFQGGHTAKVLSRSRLILPTGDAQETPLLAMAADEESLQINCWNVSSGALHQKLPVSEPVLDLCALSVNNQHYLAALSEKQIKLFRWQTR